MHSEHPEVADEENGIITLIRTTGTEACLVWNTSKLFERAVPSSLHRASLVRPFKSYVFMLELTFYS